MTKQQLIEALIKQNIPFTNDGMGLLEKVMENTIKTNESFNLTSITNEEEFREKMIYDSVIGVSLIGKSNKECIDVGTGAGFPGLPLAIINPDNNYTLLDATKKKIDHIQKLVDSEKISNVHTINDRVENFAKNNREKFDYAFARAVAPLSILIELIIPILKVGGEFIAYKGKNAKQEIKEAENALRKLNCELKVVQYEVLPVSKEERYLVVVSKNKETDKKYPRDYSLIVSKPL